MRSIEQISQSAHAQRNEQQARLVQLAARKHERVAALAGKIGRAASFQMVWQTVETAEQYLERLGIDITAI